MTRPGAPSRQEVHAHHESRAAQRLLLGGCGQLEVARLVLRLAVVRLHSSLQWALIALSATLGGCSDAEVDGAGTSTTSSTSSSDAGGAGGATTTGGGGTGGEACSSMALRVVSDELSEPIFAASAAGDPARLYVVEEQGAVRLVKDGHLADLAFLDLEPVIQPGQEKGVLGLAFHPEYEENGRLWVLYVGPADRVIVAEYARSADPDQADPIPVRELFAFDALPLNHVGGNIAFGPDGFLYVGIGGNKPQQLDTKHGKILRVDVDGYPVPPPGNLTGAGVDPDVYSYGFHNPWRFSFDRTSGDLWLTDVGAIPPWEEVNFEPPGAGGRNYGYETVSGTHCVHPGCDTTGVTMPLHEYDHEGGRCAVIGGYVYRGAALPCLAGAYLFTDLCSRQVWALRQTAGALDEVVELTAVRDDGTSPLIDIATVPDTPVSFGEDAAGELYIVGLSGTLVRFEPGE